MAAAQARAQALRSGAEPSSPSAPSRPPASSTRIRRPEYAEGSLEGDYNVGDAVEYFGATQAKWMPAKVLRVNGDGTWDLDCKPKVRQDKIRRLLVADAAYAEGDTVEYYGATQGRWVLAKVLKVNPEGTFDLDCKLNVAPGRIQLVGGTSAPPPGSPRASLAGPPTAAGSLPSLPASPRGSHAGELRVDDTVEYFSSSMKKWIPAKVTKAHPDGTYDLDCKPNVAPDKVRRRVFDAQPRQASGGGPPPPRTSGGGIAEPAYAVGEVVEYFGAAQQRWIRSKVIQAHADGASYDLECKQSVQPSRMRRPGPSDPLQDTSGLAAQAGPTGKPVQLVRVERAGDGWRFEVCQEGVAALERYGPRRAAVAAFCGAESSGHGSLVDLVLPSRHASPAAAPGGLWLWGALEGEEGQGDVLALLACEPFGSRGADVDAQLATLCALLSSVLVVCTRGELVEEVFEALAPLARLEVSIEERGGDSRRPKMLWVLKDHPRPGEQNAGDLLEGALRPAAPGSGQVQPQGQASHVRDVKSALLRFFRQRECIKLPADNLGAAAVGLRAMLSEACAANPKAVGGQPLDCGSLAALLGQLVAAMNDKRVLSVKGAWETVQHTHCGGLADELRAEASALLHKLVAGQPLPGGAKLPLTDDGLHACLRDQRRALKSKWEARAIGDESVRREYWCELKDTLAREEALVRAQNTRAADQDLMEALRRWGDWLDKEADQDAGPLDEACGRLGQLMERMPAGPVARAGRQALLAAARRMASVRRSLEAVAERRTHAEGQALAFGQRSTHQEAASRSQLEELVSSVSDGLLNAEQVEQAARTALRDREAGESELVAVRAELQDAITVAEAARGRERALRAQRATMTESASALKAELEQLQTSRANTGADQLASARCARTAEEVASIGRSRVEEQLARARAEAEKYQRQLEEERSTFQGENERTAAEHRRRVEEVRQQLEEERRQLAGEQERARAEHFRMVEEARRQLDEERIAYTGNMDTHKGRLLERARDTGILEGKAQALQAESTSLKDRLLALEEQVRKANHHLDEQSRDAQQAKEDLAAAQEEASNARAEAHAGREADVERYRRDLQDFEEEHGRKPKCGCQVQ